MTLLAAHLNDAGITVLDADRILYREPGFALLEDDALVTGSAAERKARVEPRRIQDHYWSQLTTDALPDRRFQHLSAAELVSRQMEQMWTAVDGQGKRLAVAVPAYMSAGQLGLLLGIAAELGIEIVAMVDAAVAATRREYANAVPVHIDIGLHAVTLTRLTQAGGVKFDRSEVVEDSGLVTLNDAWLKTIAEAFVRQSRFDPLHTAETEQALYDSLPRWIAAASAAEKVAMTIEFRGIAHEAEVESLELAGVVAPVYHRVVGSLRALYRAGELPALQLSHRAASLLGFADALASRVGGEVFLLESGATARGLLARSGENGHPDGISLVRHLHWDQSPVTIDQSGNGTSTGLPTHLLFDNVAYTLGSKPLQLGSQAPRDGRTIELDMSMPGVSRRHCTVQQQNGQCIVQDQSRYGTFLNGHRIDGSAALQVGDVLRIGTPGYELRLITTEQSHGS